MLELGNSLPSSNCGPMPMPPSLRVSLGQYSDKGRKDNNQDFHGACIPDEPQLSSKGIAIALADGISSSAVSRIASEAAVKGFLEDYFCTSPAWSVKTSAQRVLMAVNSWLHAQTRQSQYRYDQDRGYVCTLSALVLKACTAHLFHVGDARIYRVRDGNLEQLTEDHRLWISREESYLSRALGVDAELQIDYRSVALRAGDVFCCATDGVHEFITPQLIIDSIAAAGADLDAAAKAIALAARERGSADNLTAQLVRIDAAPEAAADELPSSNELPLPPALAARMRFEGYTIVREIHCTSRSYVHLGVDELTGERVAIKTPALDRQHDAGYLERFLLEDWIARRIDNPHVVRPCAPTRTRNYLYNVTEFIEGSTLRQWMIDHPRPALETVRGIVEQIARGLQAFHRLEMLHQDLRPENIMIDVTGTVKIVDFGAVRVAGIAESATTPDSNAVPGTFQYTAPEYFLGEAGSVRSDQFSLGVIMYQMLTGELPYGAEVAKCTTRRAQHKLRYRSILHEDRAIPAWLDAVLRKATQIDPARRYEELSEWLHDLRHPNPSLTLEPHRPLAERNPVRFWKAVSCLLLLIIVALLMERFG